MKKIFLSWSGDISRQIAEIFYQYLPSYVDAEYFLALRDNKLGEDWGERVKKELRETNIGIFFFTEQNLDAPWMIYEAGAIGKLDGSRVFPLYFGVSRHHDGPIKELHYQSASFNKSTYEKLIESLYELCNGGEIHYPAKWELLLDKLFNSMEKEIQNILSKAEAKKSDSTSFDLQRIEVKNPTENLIQDNANSYLLNQGHDNQNLITFIDDVARSLLIEPDFTIRTFAAVYGNFEKSIFDKSLPKHTKREYYLNLEQLRKDAEIALEDNIKKYSEQDTSLPDDSSAYKKFWNLLSVFDSRSRFYRQLLDL